MSRMPFTTSGSGSAALQNAFGGNPFDAEGNLKRIPPSALVPWEGNPFKAYSEQRLRELAESIHEHGLMNPVIVRPIGSGAYQILAGHNRVEACKLLNMEGILCRVLRNIDDDAAAIIVTETNLKQREKMFPSEKAKAYKMLTDARKRQGKRTDLDENPLDSRIDTLAEIGIQFSDSRGQVIRYLRLNYLTPELLQRVDDETIPFRAGVALSFLPVVTQNRIHTLLVLRPDITVTIAQAEELKSLSENGAKEVTEAEINATLIPQQTQQVNTTEISSASTTREETSEGKASQKGAALFTRNNALNYARLIGALKQDKIITASQQRDMRGHVERAVEQAKREAIQGYLQVIGKAEDYEHFLHLQADAVLTGDDEPKSVITESEDQEKHLLSEHE